MEILRIPSAYYTQIEYLSKDDADYVLKTIFALASGKEVKIEKSMRGGLVFSIWREAIQMENKARAKKGEKRLEQATATLMCDNVETLGSSKHATKSNQIKSNQDLVVSKETTLQEYIKREFDNEFLSEVYNKYNLDKEIFKEECESFLNYWIEKSPNGKKEKWLKEKTFDPKLRFRQWMKNSKRWNKTNLYNKPNGIGQELD